jgi:hypothetical protein
MQCHRTIFHEIRDPRVGIGKLDFLNEGAIMISWAKQSPFGC